MQEGNAMRKIITNANVVLENGIIFDGFIKLEDDRIVETGKMTALKDIEGIEIIDAEGLYVGPGFVDIHIHGFEGKSTYIECKEAAKRLLAHGTTSFLATPYYCMNFEETMEAIKSTKAAMKETAAIKGINFEGPYINVKFGSFAHKNPWRGPILREEFTQMVDEAGETAKIWSIAPEREGILEFAEYARKVSPDVVFSVGHSEATPMQIRAMGKYAPKLQTHSMCATGQSTVWRGTRSMGPDEYCFKESDVYCELISDSLGAHVSSEMQQLLLHNKGINRIVLISDSTFHEEEYSAPKGLEEATDLNFDDRSDLAGSRLTMSQACKNIMTHTNCGIAQAFVMASLNPAKVIGLDDEIGSIFPGKTADLVFVDGRFNVNRVMLSGEVCNF